MPSIAENIVYAAKKFDAIAKAAEEQSVKIEAGGWETVFEFSDGSKIKRQLMPAACEEDSRIFVV